MERKFRQQTRQSFIYGIHPVTEALRSGQTIDKLLLKKGMRNDAVEEILHMCKERHIPVQEVPVEKLNRTTSKAHQGLVAYLSLIEYTDAENVVPHLFDQGKVPLLVVLDRVTDVRNFGAICRSAVCAGAQAIIIPSRGSAQVNEDAIKSSAGAIHQVTICRAHNLKDTIRFLKDSGVRIIGASEKANTSYYRIDMTSPVALLMGSEEDGISPEYLKLCDEQVNIPIVGPVGSLNVSVSAGILLFEAVRQRTSE